jgi:hypothetical protein
MRQQKTRERIKNKPQIWIELDSVTQQFVSIAEKQGIQNAVDSLLFRHDIDVMNNRWFCER